VSPVKERLEALLDEHRAMLHDSLDDLTEDEARARLVPSATTLLGLVKHVTWVERFWYGHAFTGTPLKEYGVPATQAGSFRLARRDTVETVRAAHREACAASRETVAGLPLDHVVDFRGGRSIGDLHTHMLRELAQHCGHADILREQVLAARG
jgi:uncharacterized damage-inducible protein DinB